MDAEQLQAQLEEAQKKIEELEKGKGGGDGLEAELEKLRGINKELIDQRDAQKRKEKELEEQRLAEQGEYKTIAEQLKAEKESLAAQLEELNGSVESYRKRDEEKFEQLKQQVPEGLRETLDDSIPLAKRIELAEKLVTQKPGAPEHRAPGEPKGNSITRAAFEAKSPADRQAFIKEGGKITD